MRRSRMPAVIAAGLALLALAAIVILVPEAPRQVEGVDRGSEPP